MRPKTTEELHKDLDEARWDVGVGAHPLVGIIRDLIYKLQDLESRLERADTHRT